MPAPPRVPAPEPGQPLDKLGGPLSPPANTAAPGADDDPRLAPAEERKEREALAELQQQRRRGKRPQSQPRA